MKIFAETHNQIIDSDESWRRREKNSSGGGIVNRAIVLRHLVTANNHRLLFHFRRVRVCVFSILLSLHFDTFRPILK